MQEWEKQLTNVISKALDKIALMEQRLIPLERYERPPDLRLVELSHRMDAFEKRLNDIELGMMIGKGL